MKIEKNILIYIIVIILILGSFTFLLTINLIDYSVKDDCQDAQAKYVGDCVQALSSLLEDEGNSFRDRNSAIWALGQLGDERAVPVLEKYYTGNIPDKESLDQGLSQYELQKALSYFKDVTNITHLFR